MDRRTLARSGPGGLASLFILDLRRPTAAKGYDGIVQRLLSIDEPKQADLIAELVDAEHLIETGDMTKQTLSLGEKSTGTRRGAPGHYDIDSALVNADGTIETAIQTYRPMTTDVHQAIKDIRSKMQQQLRAAPAANKTLAVHVDDAMKVLLEAERDQLSGLAQKLGISIDIVASDGSRIHFSGGAR
ncbi:MAG: hypothetical protein R3F43_00110 [bacterium]